MAVPSERCSARSEARREPIVGTGSTVRRWLLLEHRGPWGERALLDARLPPAVGGELRRLEPTLGIRVLLIRRPDAGRAEQMTCFAITSGPGEPWIERARFDAPGDVLRLDLAALGRGERLGLDRHAEPLFLVCTHGRHDPCCAERGRPLAQWLSVTHREQTWECTHIGGDRFAANLVAFPHGWYFGRVEPDRGPVVADAYVDGLVHLPRARGRSCFAVDVQAAEVFIRTERGLDGIDDVAPRRVERAGAETRCVFSSPTGLLAVRVARSLAQPANLTCHARDALAAPVFDLVAIEPASDEVRG